MLAMLIGCRLGRGELLALFVDSLRLREEHWVVAGILGKAGHICSVPVPGWVKAATDEWKESRGHQKLSHAVNFNYSGKSNTTWLCRSCRLQ